MDKITSLNTTSQNRSDRVPDTSRSRGSTLTLLLSAQTIGQSQCTNAKDTVWLKKLKSQAHLAVHFLRTSHQPNKWLIRWFPISLRAPPDSSCILHPLLPALGWLLCKSTIRFPNKHASYFGFHLIVTDRGRNRPAESTGYSLLVTSAVVKQRSPSSYLTATWRELWWSSNF